MNVVLIAIGCVLMALGLVMLANRSGYVYFIVGPRSVLVVAGVVAMLAFWFLQAGKWGHPLAKADAPQISGGAQAPFKRTAVQVLTQTGYTHGLI
jgi:hypothetical protein